MLMIQKIMKLALVGEVNFRRLDVVVKLKSGFYISVNFDQNLKKNRKIFKIFMAQILIQNASYTSKIKLALIWEV